MQLAICALLLQVVAATVGFNSHTTDDRDDPIKRDNVTHIRENAADPGVDKHGAFYNDPAFVEYWDSDYYKQTSASSEFSDAVTGASDRPELEGRYAVDVRVQRAGPLGTQEGPQLVGVLRGARLWRPIFDCLNEISWPRGHGQNFNTIPRYYGKVPKEGQPNWCSQYNGYCQASCKIPNIVYEASSMEYSAGGYLTVAIEWAEIWEDYHPGLRDKALNAVANAYMAMAENNANCRMVDFTGSRRTKLCYISPRVMVIFPRNGGDIKGRMNVKITFQADTKYGPVYDKYGTFDCEGSIKDIAGKVKKETKSDISQVVGWGYDKLNYFGLCQDHQCFDTHNQYDFSKNWKEQKGCEIPGPSDEV